MSTMALLPELSECLAGELTHAISRIAEPGRGQVESMLRVLSCSELPDLRLGLTAWLGSMKPELMVKRYTLMRQLILILEEIILEEGYP
jgi:hypothetical protein